MSIEKTQQRYLKHSDQERSCRGKMAFSDKKFANKAAQAGKDGSAPKSLKAYKCRHCPFWHVGKSQHVGRSLEERVECPNGCGRQVRAKRLENHLERCHPDEVDQAFDSYQHDLE